MARWVPPAKQVADFERKLALRALVRQERRREAASRRRKDQREVALGIASTDAVRRVLGPHLSNLR